jgi:type I restriction-modification system DNA methylase subunit
VVTAAPVTSAFKGSTTTGRGQRRYRPPTPAELHRAWLELVDADGPFLAIPPLKRVWPQGVPQLPEQARDTVTAARVEFERAWEKLDRDPDNEAAQAAFQQARAEWVRTVLSEVAGWQDLAVWGAGAAPEAAVASPNRRVHVAPSAALRGPDGIGALVSVVPVTESLRGAGTDGWAASQIDRMEAMLRASGIPIGIVTDGRWWALVCARPNVMVASGIVDALTWGEETRTRDAFLTLIHRRHLIGGDPSERLPQLFKESVAAAEEITEALGSQVRRAVELLVQAFSEAHADAARHGQVSPLPGDGHTVYQACVTVMMQVVFLLFAEERGLLPQSHLFTHGYGITGELDALERRALDEGEEGLDATFLTWHRLLATARALSTGTTFEDVRIPAYGGSLFDQERFPFLHATGLNGTLALPIPDRVMLHVLRSVQIAQLSGADARRICFRDIDVEQIGYIYEGLLGYTCSVVTDAAQLGLLGAPGNEPEIPLAVLEDLAARQKAPAALVTAILAWVKENQPASKPASAAAYVRALTNAQAQDAAERHLRAVTDDEELRARLLTWMPITRRDLRGRPTVVLDGGLLVTETPSRRNAGAHYTPRDLAETVVRHALEPICYFPGPYQTPERESWKLKHYDELLALKVADIAAGSGAFLVAAARYLADRVVEAWIEDDSTNAQVPDLQRRAIRQVVANCLYGVDINDMAVEMCKLSLWLVSLDKALPFSFVDDKIFHGNSLLGLTDVRQLKNLHIDPTRPQQTRFGDQNLDDVVRRAIDLRRQLASEVQENDPQRSANAKHRQLRRLHDLTTPDVELADAVIAAGLALGGKPGRQLDEAYENLRDALAKAHPADGSVPDTAFLERIVRNGLTPTVPTDYERWKPLHWVLEVPDVIVEHGGFDAIVGNPPFLGGKKLTGAMGTNMRDWYVNVLASGMAGHADLVAYFLLRAVRLLKGSGTLGLIATNTIAQGDTREVGLDQMVHGGFTLTRGVQSATWPAASANLEYAAVWGTNQPIADSAIRDVDGVEVKLISTLLEPAGRHDGKPQQLVENADIAFIGSYALGLGFVLDPEDATAWIENDERNREVLFRYLNGEDLNSRPDCSASRWVIDFNDRCETCASRFSLPYQHVKMTVKPERAKASPAVRSANWWQFFRTRPALRRAIAGLGEVLAIALVSKTVMPVRVPTRQVFSHMLGVFATDSFADQAALSSSLHQLWAVKYGSSMRADVRYTPSDVFETFPRPQTTPDLESAGVALDAQRREIMLRRDLGLTKLYNLVNGPEVSGDADVNQMRELHVRLDLAVATAYGWSDVELGHGFHSYRQTRRWTIRPAARVELMDRLLEENLRRAKEDQKLSAPAGRRGPGRRKAAAQSDQEGLF